MNESLPHQPSRSPAPPPELTSQQRQALVQALQTQALLRADPLAANLGVLTGDLMALAHDMASSLRNGLVPPSESGQSPPSSLGSTDPFLKVLRQLDRLLHIERQLVPVSRGASGYR
jgi:hypothetical protein